MSIFSGLQVYGDSWKVTGVRPFDAEEIAAVKNAEVVNSDYGFSVCFHMHSGGQTYIPLSNQSKLQPGDNVDLNAAKVLTLHREGSGDINRIDA